MYLYEGKTFQCLSSLSGTVPNAFSCDKNKLHFVYSISAKGDIIPNYPIKNPMARTLVNPMEIKIIKKILPNSKILVVGCTEKFHITKEDLLVISLSSPFSSDIKNHQHYIVKESEINRLICRSPQIIKDITPPFCKGDTVVYIDKQFGQTKVKIISVEAPMPNDDETFYGIQFSDGRVRDVPGRTIMLPPKP